MPIYNNDRITEIDAIRGVAAFAVLLFHYTKCVSRVLNLDFYYPRILAFGDMGVPIFFIVSGYVISLTLVRKTSIIDFAISRFARIYPVYWAAVLITFTVVELFPLGQVSMPLKYVLINLTMLTALFGGNFVDFAYWTLTWELSFYLVAAIIYYTRLYRKWQFLYIVMMILYIIQGLQLSILPEAVRTTLTTPAKYYHLFLAGTLLYRFSNTQKISDTLYLVPCVGIAFNHSMPEFITIITTITLFILIVKRKAGFLSNRAFLFLGSISYALYLTNQNIGYVIIKYCPIENIYIRIMVATGAALCLATVLTFYIEKPCQKLIMKGWQKMKNKLPNTKLAHLS